MSAEPSAKKAKLDDLPSHLSGMGEEAKKALLELDNVQTEIDQLNEKASDEILKIEQKYNALRVPHYEKRMGLIKTVPKFWSTAIINHPQLSSIVEDKEMELLNALTRIEVDECLDAKSGFKITFTFGPNDYIENEKIEKEIVMGGGVEPVTTTTAIKWKEGKCLARSQESESMEPLSFFEWMAEDIDPGNDDIAEILKDDLWPNPVQYYLCPDVEEVGEEYEELIDEEECLEEVDDDGASDGDN